VALLAAEPGARPIAGGTDLLPRLRAGAVVSRLLVDLRRLPLRAIVAMPDELRIGACATHAQIAGSEAVCGAFPGLAAACRAVGGQPTRNRGTIGGNLANASPAADTAPPLLAYDAQVLIAGIQGLHTVALGEFFFGPGRAALAPGELLVDIRLPWPGDRTAAVYLKMGCRQAMTVAVVSVAARLTLAEDGRIRVARLALGSVAPVPLRVVAAEELLLGQTFCAGLDLARVAREAGAACSPITDVRASADYRRRMVEVLARRALMQVCQLLAEGATNVRD
jgi:carbon-monoxide dehydrogenase medium subunit